MHPVLDIALSAEFWRRVYPANRSPKSANFAMPKECAHSLADVDALLPSWVTPELLERTGGAIHVLSRQGKHRKTSGLVVHTWQGPLPTASFYELGNNVLVETPAFMFLAAASILSTVQLIAFGYELCGLYSFDEREERGFRKRAVPLITAAKLEQFLETAVGCRGYAKAKAAVRYLNDRSASPMETFDTLAMCLPFRLGGYSLAKPHMNHEVPLTPRAARIARRGKCYLDMGYPDAHLDVEHHGKLDHASVEAQASDRARVNALKEMGFEVIELTNDQVSDMVAFEYIVQRIAKHLSKRIRRENLGVNSSRIALRDELRKWNRSAGNIRNLDYIPPRHGEERPDRLNAAEGEE